MNKTFITLFTLLFCLTSSVGWSLEYKDVVFRDGLYYKKFSHQPLTGKTIGRTIGSFKNGKKEGYWYKYWDNGQLSSKTHWKNNEMDGSSVYYYKSGDLQTKIFYKNGKKEGTYIY